LYIVVSNKPTIIYVDSSLKKII